MIYISISSGLIFSLSYYPSVHAWVGLVAVMIFFFYMASLVYSRGVVVILVCDGYDLYISGVLFKFVI